MTPTTLDTARLKAAEAERLRKRLATVLVARDEAVKDLYRQGSSPQSIASATGLSRSQVRNITEGIEREAGK